MKPGNRRRRRTVLILAETDADAAFLTDERGARSFTDDGPFSGKGLSSVR